MSDWQPIETAPKDGTHILAWMGPGEYFAVLAWEHGEWRDRDNLSDAPTHWQPLPPPPVTPMSDEPKQGVWVLMWPSKASRTCIKLFGTEKRARSEAEILESLGIEYVLEAAAVTP